ncbi:hypothetical protein [Mesorhizobium sp. Root172]|uniref:hypothetical protein n=1 Tax=Mesorhizobium sp. Root172 TaxID=1736481 RepID=UPI0006FABE1B|nr:hypothetical protein [Mesorhizobium sp. Root172]KRB22705.1 hypothetical protein ASE05_16115 [Mesorhizobium sp. Root172]
MTHSHQHLLDGQTPVEAPKDGYGPGYIVYSLATDFHALCCLIGPEAARQEMAEVINSEFERYQP